MIKDRRDGLRACNFFVSRWERTKVSELLLEGLQPILFVAVSKALVLEAMEDISLILYTRMASNALGDYSFPGVVPI